MMNPSRRSSTTRRRIPASMGQWFLICSISTALANFWVGSSLWSNGDEDGTGSEAGVRRALAESHVQQLLEEQRQDLEEQHQAQIEKLVEAQLQQRVIETCGDSQQRLPTRPSSSSGDRTTTTSSRKQEKVLDPRVVGDFVQGVVATPRSEFMDLGIPMDTDDEEANVLVLYGDSRTLPNSLQSEKDRLLHKQKKKKSRKKKSKKEDESHVEEQPPIPVMHHQDALENCNQLLVLPLQQTKRKSCLALVPHNQDAFHVQNWMRMSEQKDHGKFRTQPEFSPLTVTGGRSNDTVAAAKIPLRLVSRGLKGNGVELFATPRKEVAEDSFAMLRTFFDSKRAALRRLRTTIQEQKVVPFPTRNHTDAEKAQKKKRRNADEEGVIIVMVCNFGQSEILMNFVCNARSRGLDTSSILVFATDVETQELAQSLGLAAHYDKAMFGDIPSEAAKAYGDRNFRAMMAVKIMSVHLVAALGYDVLFQDADVIWFQHPLRDYFLKKEYWSQEFDMTFQEDGARSLRFAPYDVNSGFYFVRRNDRTRSFLDALLLNMPMILSTKSHQQAMIAVLSEHVSVYGLRVKVVSRESGEMPCGHHWHRQPEYMHALFRGEVEPVVFHMSWTENKDNKLKFFQQMGEWYLNDQCVGKKVQEIQSQSASEEKVELLPTCCTAEPIFRCHYRDKPSVRPCLDSPSIDNGRRGSFWGEEEQDSSTS